MKVSPYNENKGMLTITSANRRSLLNLIDYMYNHKLNFLRGDALIASKNGDFKTFRFQKEVKRPFYENSSFDNIGTRNYIMFALGIFIMLIFEFILYRNKNRKLK